MDVFVLPSLSEGLPLSLLEAMAAGKPIVATSVGGVPEVVRDGHTGFLVPPCDPDALAARVLFVLQDPAVASQVAAAGRARVREAFSLETMVAEYRALYEDVLAFRDTSG
jgi:glycosyltransferase involved in cell wall biosynthesis